MNSYEKNLQAIKKCHPELTELIEEAVVKNDRIKILSSQSGVPRVLYKTADGGEIYIHNETDPADCANQAIDLLGKIEKEGIIVLFGFGLGYFAEEVLKRFEEGHLLLIYEATPELFKAALMTRDLSGFLNSEKVKIILGQNADNFSVIHSHHHLVINGKFWIVKHHPSIKLNNAAYDTFFKRLDEERMISDIGVRTIIGRGKEFINAFLTNIPSVINMPGVSKLMNIFKGRPFIIVSAGPSLDKNLHLLKKAKGKAIIVSVDGALPTLLPCGIMPDIVVAVDPVVENIDEKFRDSPLLKNIPFVCLSQYTPEAINIYPGPLFVNNVPQNVAYQWLNRFWEDKGYIESFGGSVAHLAFAAAEFMGADSIAFVGQDLSFRGNRVHTHGYSDSLDRLAEDASRKGLESMPGSFTVENIFNEKVFTIKQFLIFRTSFESRIKNFKGRVVNATEDGLSIEGAVNIRLADYIDEYCSNFSETDTLPILTKLQDKCSGLNLDELISTLTSAVDIFKEIKKTSSNILKHIKKIQILREKGVEDSAELHNRLDKVETLIERGKNPLLNLLVTYHYGLELYLMKQDTKAIDDMDDKMERLGKQLERGQNYYSEVVKAIELFAAQLENLVNVLKKEKKINEILSDDSLELGEKFYRAALIYKKAGMISQAVKYLERLEGQGARGKGHDSELRTPNSELLITLAELYIKQFRFYEAKEILTAVRSQESEVRSKGEKGQGARGKESSESGVRRREQERITHNASRITDLLKTCDKKIKAWEERKERMQGLIKKAEENYGGNLESGYFYFRVKDYERSEKAYLKAIEEGQGARGKGHDSELRTPDSELVSAAFYGLAHTYLAKNESEKAFEAFEKAIETDPKNPVLYRDLGLLAYQNNNIESAELFFIKALELSPQDIELYKTLAELYVGAGEMEKAAALYEDALLANPGNPIIQQGLAMLYKKMITNTGRA